MTRVPNRRWLSPSEVAKALLFALPGIAVTLMAKPLKLGDAALLGGIFFAFAVPILWLTDRDSAPH